MHEKFLYLNNNWTYYVVFKNGFSTIAGRMYNYNKNTQLEQNKDVFYYVFNDFKDIVLPCNKNFIIWRDPYKRLISLYTDLATNPNSHKAIKYLNREPDKLLESFIDFFIIQGKIKNDPHTALICDLFSKEHLNKLDCIVNIEDLDSFLKKEINYASNIKYNVTSNKETLDLSIFEQYKDRIYELYSDDLNWYKENQKKIWNKNMNIKDKNNQIHVYCLTTEGSERYKWQLEHNKFLGNSITYVFGKKFNKDMSFFDQYKDQKWGWQFYYKNINNGDILTVLNKVYSCMEGHKRCVEMFNNSKYKYAIIMEDDTELPNDIFQIVYTCYNKFPAYNWFHLSNEYTKYLIYKIPLSKKFELKEDMFFQGAGCYAINKWFSNRYLEYYKGDTIADIFLSKTYLSFPCIYGAGVKVNETLHYNSTLENRIKK